MYTANKYIMKDDIQTFRKHCKINSNMALPQGLSNKIFETLSHSKCVKGLTNQDLS